MDDEYSSGLQDTGVKLGQEPAVFGTIECNVSSLYKEGNFFASPASRFLHPL